MGANQSGGNDSLWSPGNSPLGTFSSGDGHGTKLPHSSSTTGSDTGSNGRRHSHHRHHRSGSSSSRGRSPRSSSSSRSGGGGGGGAGAGASVTGAGGSLGGTIASMGPNSGAATATQAGQESVVNESLFTSVTAPGALSQKAGGTGHGIQVTDTESGLSSPANSSTGSAAGDRLHHHVRNATPLLSDQLQEMLQNSWAVIDRTPGGQQNCVRGFYRTMLERGGESTRRMFAYTDMQKQSHMLTSVVGWALGSNFSKDGLRRIGVLHSHLGVTEKELSMFRDCFIETLKEESGKSWRPEYGDAWAAIFESICVIMVPAMQEADNVIDVVTHAEVGSKAMSGAHMRLKHWFQERLVPVGVNSMRFQIEESEFQSEVSYGVVRAPLTTPPEFSRRIIEVHGRLVYLNLLDGRPGGFIDMRSVSDLTHEVNQENTQFNILIETHNGQLRHFLSFDSETLAERWFTVLTRRARQFSNMEPAPSQNQIDNITKVLFQERHLDFEPTDFEYLTLVGKGSFGKVVKVMHKSTHKVYAMKIIQKSSFSTVRNIVEVRRERTILETVDSPFIVKFYGFFQSDEKLYFLFDFLSGGELFYHMKCAPDHHFSEDGCRFYLAEIAVALEHLRTRHIVHRDIKGDNFVLDADGHVTLTDFGFAKTVEKAKRNTATCGTLAYIAPEVLAPGPVGYDYEVDWWSLGVVLFTMLTGYFPFLRNTPQETAKAIVYEPVRFPSNVITTHNARALCRGLMHKNPKQRICCLADLQAQPFFANFDWDKLITRRAPPPFVPDSSGANTKYFNSKYTQLKYEGDGTNEHEVPAVGKRENDVFGSYFFEQEVFASEVNNQKVQQEQQQEKEHHHQRRQ